MTIQQIETELREIQQRKTHMNQFRLEFGTLVKQVEYWQEWNRLTNREQELLILAQEAIEK